MDGMTKREMVLFALIVLGSVEAIINELLSASDAVTILFNVENCLYIKKRLHNETSGEIMSSGVRLPDLFDALPTQESH
jgi:hypothetical protein